MENEKINIEELNLTEKQKAFCREYILDWNCTKAAIRAGYSEKTAYSIGSENLRKPEIKTYLEHLQKNIQEVAGISQLMILQEHMKLAFSSIAHLHNTWIERKEFENLTDDQKACISEITTQIKRYNPPEGDSYDVEFVKLKLYDKQKALDSISKMLGYDAPQKIDHTTKGESMKPKIDLSKYTDDELRTLIDLQSKGGVGE